MTKKILNINNSNSSLKDELKRKLKNAAEETTSHGIPHILRTRNVFLKIMWSIFLLASLGYCIYFITKMLIQYFQFQTSTSIDYIQETPAQFPAITICNTNPIKLEDGNAFLQYLTNKFDNYECLQQYENYSYSDKIDGYKACYNVTSSYAFLTRQMDKVRRYIANENMSDQNRSIFGFDLKNDMLLTCEFNKIPCNADNFTQFWSKIYGNCYTFNDGINQSILQTNKVGSKYGLILEMVVCK